MNYIPYNFPSLELMGFDCATAYMQCLGYLIYCHTLNLRHLIYACCSWRHIKHYATFFFCKVVKDCFIFRCNTFILQLTYLHICINTLPFIIPTNVVDNKVFCYP